jgi:hypothetical protein
MSIRDTTKKQRRKRSSKSSSSGKTVLSKTPGDVLELGQHLVRELNLDDTVDTLGRWIAHYIAELIIAAEKATSKKDRLVAQKRATEAILRIWEHRESLPGYAYPLARYDEILSIMDYLRPDNNPFRFNQMRESKVEQSAAILFDHLTRLVISLLFMKIDSLKKPLKADAAAVNMMDEDEKRVLDTFHSWIDFFSSSTKSKPGRRNQKPKATKKIDVREIALELIDGIGTETAALRTFLEGNT